MASLDHQGSSAIWMSADSGFEDEDDASKIDEQWGQLCFFVPHPPDANSNCRNHTSRSFRATSSGSCIWFAWCCRSRVHPQSPALILPWACGPGGRNEEEEKRNEDAGRRKRRRRRAAVR